MRTSTSNIGWDQFLPVRRFAASLESLVESQSDKIVFLTGAGGCIGSAIAKTLLRGRPRLVVLLDHSERALQELVSELACMACSAPYKAALGDVRSETLLHSLFRKNRPDLILHAAAFKHVPLMEENPFAAIQNNAVATWELARIAADFRVPRFLLISTDKAANPRSIMGASKRLAEISVSRWNEGRRDYSAIRLGNVIGSQGSVVPLFLQQIARGGPVTVTHPEVSRFFLTIEDAVQLILSAAVVDGAHSLLLPELGEPIKIADLAGFVIRRHAKGRAPKIGIQFTTLRPGDKLSEDLISISEELHPSSDGQLRRISGPSPAPEIVDETFARLKESAQACDLEMMLEATCQLVPEYLPSDTLLNVASNRTPLAKTRE